MWSDEKAELKQSIKQSIIWSVWYLMAWTALMIPVTKVML
jgi:hypothetical protein